MGASILFGMSTPLLLHTVAQVRAIERHYIDIVGVPSFELMTCAGTFALRQLRARWLAAREILILAGGGNNAGDGYILAREALAQGLSPCVLALTSPEALRGDAALAVESCRLAGVPIERLDKSRLAARLSHADVVVDAIFGIGLQRDLSDELCDVVALINASSPPVLAIDVPSGLCADTGKPRPVAIRADLTVTFIAHKLGLNLLEAAEWVGTLVLGTLTDGLVPRAAAPHGIDAVAQRLDSSALHMALPPRTRTINKGDAGHVVVVGGGLGMPGAARLAAIAALRVGAGKVTVVCHPSSAASIATGHPELMVRPLQDHDDLRRILDSADVRIVGPGLGRDAWAEATLDASLDPTVPMVLDADALTLIAERSSDIDEGAPSLRPWVMTPHPGEAARLLGEPTCEIQADRLAALRALQQRYSSVVVLKGAGTWISCTERMPSLCVIGEPRLATAGTGDVLAGAIAGIWAQQRDRCRVESAASAARAAVWLHAISAQGAADRGMLAGELADELAVGLARCLP